MDVFNNEDKKVVDDLRRTIQSGSRLSVAAASFSIYAYQALAKELANIDQLRFIFTGYAFTKEKTPKEAREFYIPRLNTERSLYGADYEIKLRNELN